MKESNNTIRDTNTTTIIKQFIAAALKPSLG